MTNILHEMYLSFIEIMGATQVLMPYEGYFNWNMLLFCALLTITGFIFYRYYFALMVFFATGIGCVYIFSGFASWGQTIAIFSVLGLLLCAIAYNLKTLAAIGMSLIFACFIILSFTDNLAILIVSLFPVFLLAAYFPRYTIIGFTGFMGALGMVMELDRLSYFSFNWIAVAVVFAVSVALQIVLSRHKETIQIIKLTKPQKA